MAVPSDPLCSFFLTDIETPHIKSIHRPHHFCSAFALCDHGRDRFSEPGGSERLMCGLQELMETGERDGFHAIVGAKFRQNFLDVVSYSEPANVKLFADRRRVYPFG